MKEVVTFSLVADFSTDMSSKTQFCLKACSTKFKNKQITL